MIDESLEDNYPFLGDASGTGSARPSRSTDTEPDPSALRFDAEHLDEALAAASESAIDEADFGLIRVDDDGTVEVYNQFEANFAGVNPAHAVGRNFFTQVAPCSNNSLFYGRFRKLRQRDHYDDRFNYTFTYKMRPTLVHVRLLNDTDGHHWIAVNPQ